MSDRAGSPGLTTIVAVIWVAAAAYGCGDATNRRPAAEPTGDGVAARADSHDTTRIDSETGKGETGGARSDRDQRAADTAPDTVTPPDASRDRPLPPGHYFVRLKSGVDPTMVTERHSIEPLEIIRDPVPAVYARLDSLQLAALQRDTLVLSLSREIHQTDSLGPPPIRGMTPPGDSATP